MIVANENNDNFTKINKRNSIGILKFKFLNRLTNQNVSYFIYTHTHTHK